MTSYCFAAQSCRKPCKTTYNEHDHLKVLRTRSTNNLHNRRGTKLAYRCCEAAAVPGQACTAATGPVGSLVLFSCCAVTSPPPEQLRWLLHDLLLLCRPSTVCAMRLHVRTGPSAAAGWLHLPCCCCPCCWCSACCALWLFLLCCCSCCSPCLLGCPAASGTTLALRARMSAQLAILLTPLACLLRIRFAIVAA